MVMDFQELVKYNWNENGIIRLSSVNSYGYGDGDEDGDGDGGGYESDEDGDGEGYGDGSLCGDGGGNLDRVLLDI
jgi:hypothetical protein